jgi:hypothetical protein
MLFLPLRSYRHSQYTMIVSNAELVSKQCGITIHSLWSKRCVTAIQSLWSKQCGITIHSLWSKRCVTAIQSLWSKQCDITNQSLLRKQCGTAIELTAITRHTVKTVTRKSELPLQRTYCSVDSCYIIEKQKFYWRSMRLAHALSTCA